jgi:serine/threonine protein kinase/tetratricopeptide (TPR) repeat protein
MVGQTISHYRVLEKLGGGGMGIVYLAEDTTLGRKVALKFLPAEVASNTEARARLLREARAASSLNHPNICIIHEIADHGGQPFIAMEWLEGETLKHRLGRGPLPVDAALEVTVQIADALDAAHSSGILHRDLKPANLFLTKRGTAKILDFGLAKMTHEVPPGDLSQLPTGAPDPYLTSPGTTVGTLAYMAPEQARGERVDARSDLFALGAVLYEMLTGRPAFRGATTAVTFDALLNRQPPPVRETNHDFPAPLDEIIMRLLAKDPGARLQSARALRDELRTIARALQQRPSPSATATKGPSSIAVLPFANLSADPENEYFSDGLAEELINALTRLPGLRVASRTSAFQFRGKNADIREIGRQLSVDHVLEGSVRRAGKRLRITAQLISVADGYHLWSERYDREMADVFDIQDEITAAIVGTLRLTLVGTRRPSALRHTDNIEAFELYLKGRHHWYQRTPQSLRMGIAHFEQAIRLDPDYALAHAGLADSHTLLALFGYTPLNEGRSAAETSARRALELAPALPESHYAMALLVFWLTETWPDAEVHFTRALETRPRFPAAHAHFGLFLAARHRHDEARAHISEALALDALSPHVHANGALSMYLLHRSDEALRLGQRALELQPDFALALWAVGVTCCRTGKFDEAAEAFARLMSLSNRAPFFVAWAAFAHALAGRRNDALALTEEIAARTATGYVHPLAPVLIGIGLRDRDKTQNALTAYIDHRGLGFLVEYVVPYLEPWIAEPQFADLLQRLHLVSR